MHQSSLSKRIMSMNLNQGTTRTHSLTQMLAFRAKRSQITASFKEAITETDPSAVFFHSRKHTGPLKA